MYVFKIRIEFRIIVAVEFIFNFSLQMPHRSTKRKKVYALHQNQYQLANFSFLLKKIKKNVIAFNCITYLSIFFFTKK